MVRHTALGQSLPQALLVVSIVLSCALLATPSLSAWRRDRYTHDCAAQLRLIGAAVQRYRADHNGEIPFPLGKLAPKYLDEKLLVCPFVARIAGKHVKHAAEFRKTHGHSGWTSYFAYSPGGLNKLARHGDARFSYDEVLQRRKGETPVVVCRDHREALAMPSAPGKPRAWHFPEAPIVVLRWDGRVSVTNRGGSLSDGTWAGTDQDLLQL